MTLPAGAGAWAAAVYGVMSAVAFVTFAVDKAAAARGGNRIPERTLHSIELLGGWPGALLAAFLLRHKNRKPSYLLVTLGIVALHGAAWAWFGG